jgi:uncharacterized protein
MASVTDVILSQIFIFAPLILLFYLVNQSKQNRTTENLNPRSGLWILSCTLMVFFFICTFCLGLGIQIINYLLIKYPGSIHKFLQTIKINNNILHNLNLIGLSFWVPSLVGILLLIRKFRLGLSRILPIDPYSRVQAIALSISMVIFIELLVSASTSLNHMEQMHKTQLETFILFWSQAILFVILGFIGVGWLTKRSFKETLIRLGLFKPKISELGIGLFTGIILSIIVFLLESLAEQYGLEVDSNVTNQFITTLLSSIPGILTLGLAAAIGEETIFRGALQPRFGIVFTSLLFAMSHSQYGLNIPILIVFFIGLSLGWFRSRYNTTTSILIHATYNISLGILAIYFQ